MTAERPYRAAMPAEQAVALMRDDVGTKLCPEAFAALRARCRLSSLRNLSV